MRSYRRRSDVVIYNLERYCCKQNIRTARVGGEAFALCFGFCEVFATKGRNNIRTHSKMRRHLPNSSAVDVALRAKDVGRALARSSSHPPRRR